MANEKKTRLVIRSGSQTSEILSIREKPHGDLFIFLKTANEVSSADFEATGNNEYRFSIHTKGNWGGHTFLQHLRTADGYHRRWYAKIKLNQGHLLWPLITGVCTDLSNPRYASTPNKKDEIVDIGSYDPKSFSLFYGIVILSKGFVRQVPFGRNERLIEFSAFDVLVIWHFSPTPSFNRGQTFYPFTAIDFEKDGASIKEGNVHELTSRNVEDLFNYFRDAFGALSKIHYNNLVALLATENLTLPPSCEILTRTYFPVATKS